MRWLRAVSQLTILATSVAFARDTSRGVCGVETSLGFHPHCSHANVGARGPRTADGRHRRGPGPLLAGLDALMAASAVDLAGCYEGSESSALGASRRLASALWFIARLSATRELAPRSTPPVPPHEPTEERIPPPEHESSPAAALRPAPEVGAKGDERNAHEEPDNPHPVPVDTNRQRSPPSSFQTQSLHGHRG